MSLETAFCMEGMAVSGRPKTRTLQESRQGLNELFSCGTGAVKEETAAVLGYDQKSKYTPEAAGLNDREVMVSTVKICKEEEGFGGSSGVQFWLRMTLHTAAIISVQHIPCEVSQES